MLLNVVDAATLARRHHCIIFAAIFSVEYKIRERRRKKNQFCKCKSGKSLQSNNESEWNSERF